MLSFSGKTCALCFFALCFKSSASEGLDICTDKVCQAHAAKQLASVDAFDQAGDLSLIQKSATEKAGMEMRARSTGGRDVMYTNQKLDGTVSKKGETSDNPSEGLVKESAGVDQSSCHEYNDNRLMGEADAEIVIAMEAAFSPYNYIDDKTSKLVGFDVELTQAVCDAANVKCAIVTAPWQSMWADSFPDLGFESGNPNNHPGIGFHNSWYDCSSGTRNTAERAETLSFTHPYTNPEADRAGFFGKSSVKMAADASDVKIGLQKAYAVSAFFMGNNGKGKKFNAPSSNVKFYTDEKNLFKALADGDVDVIFVGESLSKALPDEASRKGEWVLAWSNGVSYACHPSKGEAVAKLNFGIEAFKATPDYKKLCDKYSDIPCDDAIPHTYSGNRLTGPETADIVIAMEAAFSPYNYIDEKTSKLAGFDVELTQAVCDAAGVKCAIVTAPWQSMWADSFPDLGFESGNPNNYPGIGFHSSWFDCSSGTRNTPERAETLSFTHPYTNPEADRAGFFGKSSVKMTADASDVKIGLQKAYAVSAFFMGNNGKGKKFNAPSSNVKFYTDEKNLFKALADGDVDVIFVGESLASSLPDDTSRKGDWVLAWSNGVSYACHPSKSKVVTKLNEGLVAFKATSNYKELCKKYSEVPCDDANPHTYDGNRLTGPENADIVIAMEAAFSPFNYIDEQTSKLIGFDVEQTKAVCDAADVKCAIVTAPWQSMWADSFPDLGFESGNPNNHPGIGFHNSWFDCSSGTRNTAERAETLSFTHPYTNPESDRAGFFGKSSVKMAADASDVKIGLQKAYAVTAFFMGNNGKGKKFNAPGSNLNFYTDEKKLFKALADGDVDVIFVGETLAETLSDENSRKGDWVLGWSNGVSYACHPSKASVIQKLNDGLARYKMSQTQVDLCKKFKDVDCDCGSDDSATTEDTSEDDASTKKTSEDTASTNQVSEEDGKLDINVNLPMKTADDLWSLMGDGCCEGKREPDNGKLFGLNVSDIDECKKKCRTFNNCGIIEYGWTDMPQWCYGWGTSQKCEKRDADCVESVPGNGKGVQGWLFTAPKMDPEAAAKSKWEEIGSGCCAGAREESNGKIYANKEKSLDDCKARCLTFDNCGIVEYGWTTGDPEWCYIWDDSQKCTKIDSGCKDSAMGSGAGAKAYRLTK